MEVINKYEIISERISEDKNTAQVKVNYYCDHVVSAQATNTKSEKTIKMSGGEPLFFEVNCSDFFQYYYSDKKQIINEDSALGVFDFKNNIQTVNFGLVRDGVTWKINGPAVQPHISQETLNTFLNQ